MRMLVSRSLLPYRYADQTSRSNILRLLKGPIYRPAPSRLPSRVFRCLSTRNPEAFNTHRQGGRGSGLVQDVLCSPARIPAAESRRRGPCAAPANIKRSTFSRVIWAPKIDWAGDAVIGARLIRSAAPLNRSATPDDSFIRSAAEVFNGAKSSSHLVGFDQLKR